MLKFISSLTFLYAFAITVLLGYGLVYYRDFVRSARLRKKFPLVFLLISVPCVIFLWINIHASLKMQTFSNLDHHFIRQDGFLVNKGIEFGKADTVGFDNNSFNSFSFAKEKGQVNVISHYSEDPFYTSANGKFQLLSVNYPATGHSISFVCDTISVSIKIDAAEEKFQLSLNEHAYSSELKIKKGSSVLNAFKDEEDYVNSSYYTQDKLSACLRQIMILRDDVSRKEGGELKFFISGRLFRYVKNAHYDQQVLSSKDIQFKKPIADKSFFAWGIGFLDNNKNQFYLETRGGDSFSVMNRYPVSYPLTEENSLDNSQQDWSEHGVNKFLLSDSKPLQDMAAVFREGFLFPVFERDSVYSFSPVLLTYQKAAGNKSLQLEARWLNRPSVLVNLKEDRLVLPSRSHNFSWLFSIRNTFDWELSTGTMKANTWQLWLFGSLGFFILIIFFTSIVTPADRLSWIWQLLSCIVVILLTTRYFLYWRYKSFPPYEGMDLASQQQLNSSWNFAIIVMAALTLGIVFGFGLIKYIYAFVRPGASPVKSRYATAIQSIGGRIQGSPIVARIGSRTIFFSSWLAILGIAGITAFTRHFDPGTCRHLAIALMIIYFIYVFISYKQSPLVVGAEKSWWRINTTNRLDILVSNPVKVLLSISLLAVFVFIDIGFAIVFLNFLLFHEAFLGINYAVAGLSAGSRRNALLFGTSGIVCLFAFIINLLYAPYIFSSLINLPQSLYLAGYVLFAIVIGYNLLRLFIHFSWRQKMATGIAISGAFFLLALFFFPKERILEKAAMTKYRIDVLTMPVDKAIESAYGEGKTYEPVIRAAQNQWFINTLIYEKNNPGVQSAGFHLLPQAPQNKGAKYNAQATDLVASRFFLAEHGKWSVLLFVLLLILPTTLLASFYKLYPDFTNRINTGYPTITAGFSILNYLLISALLVILAATGRYIFFGQDLPFGSILSKQSILFPSILIVTTIWLFRNISLEYYSNRRKFIPGLVVLLVLAFLLFIFKPGFNKNREFNADDLAINMENFVQSHLQPLMDHFDTSATTRRYPLAKKDQLFTDSLRKQIAAGYFTGGNKFFENETRSYARQGFTQHVNPVRLLYLDMNSGSPKLSVNENYFRVEPPPHLQQAWRGNVFGDSAIYNIAFWNGTTGTLAKRRLTSYDESPGIQLTKDIMLAFGSSDTHNGYSGLYLVNTGSSLITVQCSTEQLRLAQHDSLLLTNPGRVVICDSGMTQGKVLSIEPDAYMRNYYVNGGRFYAYPLGSQFIWARNFAESISSDYASKERVGTNAFVSFDFELMDSVSQKIQAMMNSDTAYKKGAEYGVCIADGRGRMIAMTDFIKDFYRPDPNNKVDFAKIVMGEDGWVSQSLLRKQIGNINLLRLNPGPGSTFKPIAFSAIASQINFDWDNFSSEGFSLPQQYYGGERVPEYDFEKNNGRISSVADYLKYSDNYYHSNVLLLGSYPRQEVGKLLSASFVTQSPGPGIHWPYFTYQGNQYWLDGFENWPGYAHGEANFGMNNSSTSVGLLNNYGIYTHSTDRSFDMFPSFYDSCLFGDGYRRSGFILPEYSLFDQEGTNVNRHIPYDLFTTCFRGHVKGSSQVMVSPAKMVEAFGKMISQNRRYALTLNPAAPNPEFSPFDVDSSIMYNNYLSLMREGVFAGMREVLNTGTGAALGALLKNKSSYHYYAKTGTTGDNELKTKSKLMVVIISEKDITDPGFNFRDNKFYTIYFTSQNGPAKQNEQFQYEIIQYVQRSQAFREYMKK